MSAKNAVFDGFDFAANGLTITAADMYSRARKLQLEERVLADGAVQVGDGKLPPKPITLNVRLSPRASTDELETAIDLLMLYFNADKRVLDITHAGGFRRYLASVTNIGIVRERGAATVAGFNVEFVVPDGYGYSTATETLLSATQTAQSVDHAITVGGTYKAQPDIAITINSLTDGAPQRSIIISNPQTTESTKITRNWSAGDVILLNSVNRAIYVNNERRLSVGAFPSWKPTGPINPMSQYINVTDDFTTRGLSILATYQRRWL